MRNVLRNVKAKCVKCRKQRAGVSQPLLAVLSRERLQERVFHFTNTGLVYFGPFEVKFMRKTLERWCCLFICLTTRAVHKEVVPSLEAETCLISITMVHCLERQTYFKFERQWNKLCGCR